MPIFFLAVGVILIAAAWQNSLIALFRALAQDIAGYGRWALAIVVIGLLGVLPGMRVPTRYLLALIFLVIILTNYRQAIAGFQNIAATQPSASVTPAGAYAQATGTGGPAAPATQQPSGSPQQAAQSLVSQIVQAPLNLARNALSNAIGNAIGGLF